MSSFFASGSVQMSSILKTKVCPWAESKGVGALVDFLEDVGDKSAAALVEREKEQSGMSFTGNYTGKLTWMNEMDD